MQAQQASKVKTATFYNAIVVIQPDQGSFALFTSKDKNYQDLALDFFGKEVASNASGLFDSMSTSEKELAVAAAFEEGFTEDETTSPIYVYNTTLVAETEGDQKEVDYWIVVNLGGSTIEIVYSKKDAFEQFLEQAKKFSVIELEDTGDLDDIYGQSYPKLRQSFDDGRLSTEPVFVFTGTFEV